MQWRTSRPVWYRKYSPTGQPPRRPPDQRTAAASSTDTLIWAASDSMAIAAARAAADAGLQPGKDILLTGIDWSAEGIQAVRDGRLLATAGGHFMDGALALAVIYDHSHGHGPQAEEATVRHHMGLIQRGNLDTYQPLLQTLTVAAAEFSRPDQNAGQAGTLSAE